MEITKEHVHKIQDGSLRMIIVFGGYSHLRSWIRKWDQMLLETGATFHFANNEYEWPSGAWLWLKSGNVSSIHGVVLTDYDIDASVSDERRLEWQRVLELLKRT